MQRITKAFLFVLFLYNIGYSQLIVDKGIYKVNFSNTHHEPNYVCYYLYKGGGDCERKGFKFYNDDTTMHTAADIDYRGSGYDKGHLANSEDFAFDCEKDEKTFRYYNCLPQTPNLNRGVWKKEETLIRKWSQTDSLYIICGGYFENEKIGNISVPAYCWKVVQSVSSKRILFCGWFSNTAHATLEEISVPELETRLKTKIELLNRTYLSENEK